MHLKLLIFLFRMDAGEFNPWNVTSIEEFHFYNCPECNVKYQDKEQFVGHAVLKHPKAIQYIKSITQENESVNKENAVVNDSRTTCAKKVNVEMGENFDIEFEDVKTEDVKKIKIEQPDEQPNFVNSEEIIEPNDNDTVIHNEDEDPIENPQEPLAIKDNSCPVCDFLDSKENIRKHAIKHFHKEIIELIKDRDIEDVCKDCPYDFDLVSAHLGLEHGWIDFIFRNKIWIFGKVSNEQ